MATTVETRHIPAAFVRKAPQRLQLHSKRKQAFRRLPFVNKTLWDVPATGGYFGGYDTGEALALMFLKFLRQREANGIEPHHLTWLAEAFMARAEEEGGQAMADLPIPEQTDSYGSFRGQYVGFFNTLTMWLSAASKHLGSKLDDIDDKTLLAQANAGLGFDEAAYLASLKD
ncbi:hypothetical protein [Chromobacterium haemolyticum]|jgi:hypothetical protein|uniref:Uncharacterized protein n=1 Tax=Chromobacterium haemolyticum TaxID=394935 RepID=A0A1W0C8S8_9NEIS|nr:hypothetical protein [Chromobacterium haemolyticum]OQS31132.1 hypothetical protein B0T45_23225 [Chromobacterium haemolyticum]